jgi:aerobic-type carbon monoxide dehydrogenase small subunit (CoxS/CutS family)
MDAKVTLRVNGEARTAEVFPDTSLLEVLRDDLGLTGAKYGCGEGMCGACTVLVGGKPTRSCVTPAAEVKESVVTIEGLAQGDRLHPLQQAFLEEGAMQCGYCVTGMIMSAAGLLATNPKPTTAQIKEHMEGNVCRCCTYERIVAAIERAARAEESR